MKNKKLVLLDMHAVLHRAYHALPDFVSGTGEPTGALYGLVTFLLKMMKENKPDYIAACFDLPGPTFRHEEYKEYKAGRPKADEELISQLIRARDLVAAFGIPKYELAGFEADDMIGTIVKKVSEKKDVDVVIASGDMDTLQLVSGKKVVVYTLKKGINDTIIYDEEAVKKRFGFSPKYLVDYKGLRGDPSDNIPGIKGIGEKTAGELIKHFGSLEDIFSALKKDEKVFSERGVRPRVVELLKEGEDEALFSRDLATIRQDAAIDFRLPDVSWFESFEKSRAVDFCRSLGFKSLVSKIEDIFFGVEGAGADKKPAGEPADLLMLKKAQVAVWLLDSSRSEADLSEILDFAGEKKLSDALAFLEKKIKENNLDRVYREIELPLIPVLEKMEKRGMALDEKYLKKLSDEYHAELSKIEKKIYELAGGEFNINSPKQLGEIIFDKLELKARGLRKTAGGAKSTRVSELEKLAGTHPIIDEIMRHREYRKLLSTYIDVLPEMRGADGFLHTHFVQTGTTTGRLSSKNPNLQNIPVKTELGRKIRDAFVAREGFVLVAFDYSQIELRVAAFLSRDEKMIKAFREGIDIHAAVASEVFGVPQAEVSKEMRRRAKVINFGILYGMGINALRENLETTREEAEMFHKRYFEKFTELAAYLEKLKYDAEKKGYTETYFGRRRYFPELGSSLPYIRAGAERMAINAPNQGTAADIIRLAMSRVEKVLAEKKLLDDVHLLLQVHDELLYEITKEKLNEVYPLIDKVMEDVVGEDLPLDVHVLAGDNWGELVLIDERK